MAREIEPLLKFRVVIEGEYTLDRHDAQLDYGTQDAIEIAMMDLGQDPADIISWCQGVTMSIEPAP